MGFKKNHHFDHETRKSELFACYRLKKNDFLSSDNQNLKIDIFTLLQQIPCYCKSRLDTLRLISWWRVTYQPGWVLPGMGRIPAQCTTTVDSFRLGDSFSWYFNKNGFPLIMTGTCVDCNRNVSPPYITGTDFH